MFKNKINKILCLFITIIMTITVFSNIVTSDDTILPFPIDIIDFDGDTDYLIDIQSITPISTSDSFLLYDNQPEGFGGYFADCEKSPSNDDDNLCCWAATAANMLEWTGWGFVPPLPGTPIVWDNSDDFLSYINNHTSPKGSLIELALEWWFNGNLQTPGSLWAEEEVQGGTFWGHAYNFEDYLLWTYDEPNNVQQIDEWLHQGYAVGITIHNKVTGGGGHCITVWGYEYDLRYDSENPHDYYLGLYASDSDDNKNLANPPDRLKYVKLSYNTSGDFWEFGSYKISGVTALKPFPGEFRPIADAGGLYLKEGMMSIGLDGSGSVNPLSDVPLLYRWDFTNDGTWDTPWIPVEIVTHTYDNDFDGKAKLEVFDGRLRDVDFAYIRDVTITPTLIETLTLPKELFVLQKSYSFRANYYDSIVTNFYSYEWDFGDGTTSNKPIVQHTFTNQGIYEVTLTIKFGTEPITTRTFPISVKSANEILFDLNDNISSINDNNVFDKNPDNRKKALEGMLINDDDSVMNLINSGLFDNASEKLQMIKKKMDGDRTPKDWIIGLNEQTEFCGIIDDLILYCNI